LLANRCLTILCACAGIEEASASLATYLKEEQVKLRAVNAVNLGLTQEIKQLRGALAAEEAKAAADRGQLQNELTGVCPLPCCL
jgi:hypothetical protein